MPAVPSEADAAKALQEELRLEQRVSAALLVQLHEVSPQAPGVQHPTDFNALLTALQLERQQHSAARRELQRQQREADEQRLALEAQLLAQRRELLAATARQASQPCSMQGVWNNMLWHAPSAVRRTGCRCRAWEQQSPLASIFQRCEDEVARLQAQCRRLEAEGVQLAAALAAADLDRVGEAAAALPPEAATVSRELHRKLRAQEQQLGRLRQERDALQQQVQGVERRERLGQLCRRQAEATARESADLRGQLQACQQQLEAQALAAAAAQAEATRLREQLELVEAQEAAQEAARRGCRDTAESLRQQVALLRGQAARDRVLRSVQPAM